jgi:hypothetical protein
MRLVLYCKDTFRKAIKYSLKRWKELTLFLKHPEVPLTNNEAERTIRHAVMGRKNFYGSSSMPFILNSELSLFAQDEL